VEQIQTVYLNAHLAFAGLGDPARARLALVRAAELVHARAGELSDPAARHAFLTRPRVNREIAALCRAAGIEAPAA
jgi:hypothetical protein